MEQFFSGLKVSASYAVVGAVVGSVVGAVVGAAVEGTVVSVGFILRQPVSILSIRTAARIRT